jgi:16S rRNA (uracil1498-N3)-methyltransferase
VSSPIKSPRALPRIFIPGADLSTPFEIPKPEFDKLHNVLRLRSGARIGVMPNDGTFWECELDGRVAVPIQKHQIQTTPSKKVWIAQALPKGDKLDVVIRSCGEIGVAGFRIFPSDRSVVRWESKKLEDKMRRVEAVARESAETSFGLHIPTVQYFDSFELALKGSENPVVLSELESVGARMQLESNVVTLFVGPEGGWSPREVAMTSQYSVTLGSRVLRTEHAGFAAASLILLR